MSIWIYHWRSAVDSLRRSPLLLALIIGTIGLGIGTSMTMISVLMTMNGDPLPQRSRSLYRVVMDPRPDSHGGVQHQDLSYPDAMALLRDGGATRQTALSAGRAAVQLPNAGEAPVFADGQFVTADFFTLFGVPLRYGSLWTAADDAGRAQLVVLGDALNQRLFKGADSVGRELLLNGERFRVVGVAAPWNLQPKIYADLSRDPFGGEDGFFVPLQTAMAASLDFNSHLSCFGDGGDRRDSPRCTWLQFWVQLPDAAAVHGYEQALQARAAQQTQDDRRPATALYGLRDWVRQVGIVSDSVRLQTVLAQCFLLLCIANVVGLLMVRFLRRNGETSLRRALGARRGDILRQFLIEAALVGTGGGLAGLGFTALGLWGLRLRGEDYAQAVHLDLPRLLLTLGLAVLATVLAGLLPAWRVSRQAPALQLKTL